jgi:hypothetical protein
MFTNIFVFFAGFSTRILVHFLRETKTRSQPGLQTPPRLNDTVHPPTVDCQHIGTEIGLKMKNLYFFPARGYFSSRPALYKI